MNREKNRIRNAVPKRIAVLVWSADARRLATNAHATTIVRQVLEYGDLEDLRWLQQRYGSARIRAIIVQTPASAFRVGTLRIASALFHAKTPRHASRRAHA